MFKVNAVTKDQVHSQRHAQLYWRRLEAEATTTTTSCLLFTNLADYLPFSFAYYLLVVVCREKCKDFQL